MVNVFQIPTKGVVGHEAKKWLARVCGVKEKALRGKNRV